MNLFPMPRNQKTEKHTRLDIGAPKDRFEEKLAEVEAQIEKALARLRQLNGTL